MSRLRGPLANRQFALLWGGQTVSLLGNGVISTALPILVLVSLHLSASDLGIIVAARLVPTVVLLLIGGAVTDRVSKRLAMLTSDAVRGAVTAVIGALVATGTLRFGVLVVAVLIFGTFDALFYPASTALTPEIVAADELVPANSLSQISRTLVAGLLGPVVGGIIAATVGVSWAFFFDAGTFAVSASCLAVMRSTPTPERTSTSMVHEIREGIAYCVQTSWIFWTLIVAALLNAAVFAPTAVLLPLLFKRELHAPTWMIGVGFGALGLGGLIGAVLAGTLPTPRRRVTVMWLVWSAAAIVNVGYGLAPSAWTACIFLVLVGPLLMSGQIIWESMLQSEVPRELLGRVSSVDWMISMALAPIGIAVAGVVAGIAGVRPTIVVPSVIGSSIGVIVLVFVRSLTGLDRRTPAAS